MANEKREGDLKKSLFSER